MPIEFGLVADTVTPGNTPPLLSATLPLMEPVLLAPPPWANAWVDASRHAASATTRWNPRTFIESPSSKCDTGAARRANADNGTVARNEKPATDRRRDRYESGSLASKVCPRNHLAPILNRKPQSPIAGSNFLVARRGGGRFWTVRGGKQPGSRHSGGAPGRPRPELSSERQADADLGHAGRHVVGRHGEVRRPEVGGQEAGRGRVVEQVEDIGADVDLAVRRERQRLLDAQVHQVRVVGLEHVDVVLPRARIRRIEERVG